MTHEEKWLAWAVELQSIAQCADLLASKHRRICASVVFWVASSGSSSGEKSVISLFSRKPPYSAVHSTKTRLAGAVRLSRP